MSRLEILFIIMVVIAIISSFILIGVTVNHPENQEQVKIIKMGYAHYEVDPTIGKVTLKYQCSECGFTGKVEK